MFVLFSFSCLNAQNCTSKWKFDIKTNNLQIAYNPNEPICLKFGKNEKYWISLFGETQHVKGIYAKPLLVNGAPYSGQIEGFYKNDTAAFFIEFMQGIKNGDAAFYDKKGKENRIFYDAGKHPLFVNPHRKPTPRENSGMEVDKPIIYLYPTEKTEISVKLDFNQKQLKHTYPKYNPEKGWNVIAEPNGNLKNVENGKDYYALFWEGESQKRTEIKQGFVVKGESTADFLEEKLAILGLNWRESNEFMMYWLPQMENNNYNLIHFSTEEYTNNYPITITPSPDNFIRVFMVFEQLETAIEIPAQELTPAKRGGFTAVEWGGTKQEKPKF